MAVGKAAGVPLTVDVWRWALRGAANQGGPVAGETARLFRAAAPGRQVDLGAGFASLIEVLVKRW
jgi:hypothetical protein